jgi:hypothetical protein
VNTHQIPLVQFPFLVEKLEEWAARGQHSPVGQELGATHHHGAVTKEALGPLLPEALQQLLTVFWELHSIPGRKGRLRKVPNSGSLKRGQRVRAGNFPSNLNVQPLAIICYSKASGNT